MDASGAVEYLDMSKFTRERVVLAMSPYTNMVEDVSLGIIIQNCRPAIEAMQQAGLLATINSAGDEVDSFGFAMTDPYLTYAELKEVWDDPYRLAWLVGGWGSYADKCIANAVRKLRVSARTGKDSFTVGKYMRHLIDNPVGVIDADGRFEWGDFAFGGSAPLHIGFTRPFVAASAFKQDEDVPAALLVGGSVCVPIIRSLEVPQVS